MHLLNKTKRANRTFFIRGYLYAGLEFGAECYCGHKIQASNVSESDCNMECKGEKTNLCGGPNRLSIYRLELSQESARRCEDPYTHTLVLCPSRQARTVFRITSKQF